MGKQVAGMVNKAADTWAAQSVAPPPLTPTDKAAALNVLKDIPSDKLLSKVDEAIAGVVGSNISEKPLVEKPKSILDNPKIADNIQKSNKFEYSNGTEAIKTEMTTPVKSPNNLSSPASYAKFSDYLRPDEKVTRTFIDEVELNKIMDYSLKQTYNLRTVDIKALSTQVLTPTSFQIWILEQASIKNNEFNNKSSISAEFQEDVTDGSGKTIEYSSVTMNFQAQRYSMERMQTILSSALIINEISAAVEANLAIPDYTISIPKLKGLGISMDNDTYLNGGVKANIADVKNETFKILYKVKGRVVLTFTPYYESEDALGLGENKSGDPVSVEQIISFEIERTVERTTN